MSIARVLMTDNHPDLTKAPGMTQGTCAACSGPLVANCYWEAGRFRHLVECWASLGRLARCNEQAKEETVERLEAPAVDWSAIHHEILVRGEAILDPIAPRHRAAIAATGARHGIAVQCLTLTCCRLFFRGNLTRTGANPGRLL